MRTCLIMFFFVLSGVVMGQLPRILIADGTIDEPLRFDLDADAARLPVNEMEAVKKAVLTRDFAPKTDRRQMFSEETTFVSEFVLHDVAEGFFVSREIESRAYLYTAYSRSAKVNYQGLLVMSASNNRTVFKVERHYAYAFRGDKFIRNVSDLDGNFLSELAVFAYPPGKTERVGWVRLVEFESGSLKSIGAVRIHRSQLPDKRGDESGSKVNQTPATAETKSTAIKVFFEQKPLPGMSLVFESWSRIGGIWVKSETPVCADDCLTPDVTEYADLR